MRSKLEDIASIELTENNGDTATVQTLGIRPIQETLRYRDLACAHDFSGKSLPRPDGKKSCSLVRTQHGTWELLALVSLGPGCRKVGFRIHVLAEQGLHSSVYFDIEDESIGVDRSQSTRFPDINICPERGAHTLFTTLDASGSKVQEKLSLHIFVDGNVVEIFANERFALATMVYPSSVEAKGIEVFAEGEAGSAIFEELFVWDGLNGSRHIVT